MREIDPWRARHFGAGYSAEYLPLGQASWRIYRLKGVVQVYGTIREAEQQAKDAFLRSLEPEIRATLPFDATKAERRLHAEAETFVRSSRADLKKQRIERRPGGKSFTVTPGKVSA